MNAPTPIPRMTLREFPSTAVLPNTIYSYSLQGGQDESQPFQLAVEGMSDSTILVITSLTHVNMMRIGCQTLEEVEECAKLGIVTVVENGLRKLVELHLRQAAPPRKWFDVYDIYLIYATDTGMLDGILASPRDVAICSDWLELPNKFLPRHRLGLPYKRCTYKQRTSEDLAQQANTDPSGTCVYSVTLGRPQMYVEDQDVTRYTWWAIQTTRGVQFTCRGLSAEELCTTSVPPYDIWIPFFRVEVPLAALHITQEVGHFTYYRDIMYHKDGVLERAGINPLFRPPVPKRDSSGGPMRAIGEALSLIATASYMSEANG